MLRGMRFYKHCFSGFPRACSDCVLTRPLLVLAHARDPHAEPSSRLLVPPTRGRHDGRCDGAPPRCRQIAGRSGKVDLDSELFIQMNKNFNIPRMIFHWSIWYHNLKQLGFVSLRRGWKQNEVGGGRRPWWWKWRLVLRRNKIAT